MSGEAQVILALVGILVSGGFATLLGVLTKAILRTQEQMGSQQAEWKAIAHEKDQQIDQKDKQINRLEAIIAVRDERIEQLRERVAVVEQRAMQAEDRAARAEARIDELERGFKNDGSDA